MHVRAIIPYALTNAEKKTKKESGRKSRLTHICINSIKYKQINTILQKEKQTQNLTKGAYNAVEIQVVITQNIVLTVCLIIILKAQTELIIVVLIIEDLTGDLLKKKLKYEVRLFLKQDKKGGDKMTDKFTFFASYYEAIEELDDKTRLKVYDMICRYALYGEIIESENPIEKSLFTVIKPVIDAGEKRGRGGAPVGNQNARKTTKKQPKNNLKTTQNNAKTTIETTVETTKKQPKNNLKTTQNNAKTTIETTVETTETNNININKNINKNKNINSKRGGFTPPTLSEVQAYCKERNNNVNAETFVNFYQSKDWYVGKNKMKDWKAAVRTWENKSRQENKQQEPELDSDLDKYRMLVNKF